MTTPTDAEVADEIRRILSTRDESSSACPSEVARALAGDWRPLMPLVRSVAADLQVRGEVRVTQGDQDVDPLTVRGPVRLRRP